MALQQSNYPIPTGEQVMETIDPDSTINKDTTAKDSNPYGLNMEEVKNLIIESQTASDQAYKNIRSVWKDCWDAYTCTQDYSGKAAWQAKSYIPELAPAIRKAVSLIRRILLKQEDYFDLRDPINLDSMSPSLEGQKKALVYHLGQVKFKGGQNGFINHLLEAIESGFTFGVGILKLWWEPVSKNTMEQGLEIDFQTGQPQPYFEQVSWMSSMLAAKVIDPRTLWCDPEHTYFIEENITDLPGVIALAKAGIYDKESVDKLKTVDYGTDSEKIKRLTDLNLLEHTNSYKKNVHLYEYWGDIFDNKGAISKKNAHVVLANKQYVINSHNLEHPFRFFDFLSGKPPYIIFSPIQMLFREEGRSLIEDSIPLQKNINNITNMQIDGLFWKLLKLFEVNPDRLRNPETLKNLRPGKPILTKGEGNVIREVAISDTPRGGFMEIEVLRRASQNSHGVTDFLMATQPTKGSTTKGEVVIKTQESNSLFEGIAKTIEENLIEPAIEMARQLIIQYWDDYRNPILQAIASQYGLPFAQDKKEGRIAFMLQSVQVKSTGISSYFQKQMERQELLQFLGVMSKVPPMAQRLKLRELQERILSTFTFDSPNKLIISEQEEQELQQREKAEQVARTQAMQAQAAGMGQGTPQGGGNGGSPAKPPNFPPPGVQPRPQQLGMPTTINRPPGGSPPIPGRQ